MEKELKTLLVILSKFIKTIGCEKATFDFSYEGPLLSRIRAHYYLNENDIWIRKNNRINKIRCREGSENTVIEENIFT